MKGNKKNKSRSKSVRVIFCVGMLLISAFLIVQGVNVIKTTYVIRENIEKNKAKAKELDDKKAILEDKKENLSNPDYLEYVARGKYLVSKQGEQVFKFPRLEPEE